MSDAAALVLTEPQAIGLRMAVAARREGRQRPARDPVMCALARRRLVEAQPCKANPEHRAFVATLTGREWVRANDAREGRSLAERLAPDPIWRGAPAEGSRWTAAQLATLHDAGVTDPEGCATATAVRAAADAEHDWNAPPAKIRVDMPCLVRNGWRAKVVTPSGQARWMMIVAWKAARRG